MSNSRKLSEVVQVTLDGCISDSSESGDDHDGVIPTDPWCDDENPKVVKFESISAAAYKIRDGIVKTPCDVSIICTINAPKN